MLFPQSEDHRPLFWLSGRPVYVNTLLLLLHIVAFALTALFISGVGSNILDYLGLSTYEVLHYGQVWRMITYVIFPPFTTYDAINFIFAMGFLFHFGRQVEQHVGRKTYAGLYASLVLIPAVLLCILGLFGFWQENFYGGMGTVFGVFVAFATLYPGVEISIWFVNMTAKYWAFALLAALSLAQIAHHSWVALGGLWVDAGIGYLGMRLIGAGYGMNWLTDWIEERRTARLARQHQIRVHKETKVNESIDEILEKISKQGVNSLSSRERAVLERARTDLIKRDQR